MTSVRKNAQQEASLLQTLVMQTLLDKHTTRAGSSSSALEYFLHAGDIKTSILLLQLLPDAFMSSILVEERSESKVVRHISLPLLLALKLESIQLIHLILVICYPALERQESCCNKAAREGWMSALKCLGDHSVDGLNADNRIKELQVLVKALFSKENGLAGHFVDCTGSSLLDLQDTDGKTALHYAAEAESISTMRYLSQLGASFNIQNGCQETPLLHAVNNGRPRAAKILILIGADLNGRNCPKPILHSAVTEDMHSTVGCLLDHGAAVEAQDADSGKTALMTAIEDQNIAIFNLIMMYADATSIELADHKGRTAFHHAVEKSSIYMARVLWQQGASVNAQDGFGTTPLMRVLSSFYDEEECLKIVKFLVEEAGVDLNVQGNSDTALSLACFYGKLSLVQYLVEHGADVNLQTKVFLSTPLMASTLDQAKRQDIVNYLCKNGANVHLQDCFGQTVMHKAANRGSVSMLETLIAHGANIFVQTRIGETPLHIAIKNGSVPMFDLFLQYANAYSVNVQDAYGNTALFHAADRGSLYMVRRLLLLGANADVRVYDTLTLLMLEWNWHWTDKKLPLVPWHGETALHRACRAGSVGLVQCFVDHGVDVDILIDKSGWTPLMTAILNPEYGQEIVEYLCHHGANVHWKTWKGQTVVHHVAIRGTCAMLETLVAHGADMLAHDNDGKSPLQIAWDYNNDPVADFIKRLNPTLPMERLVPKDWDATGGLRMFDLCNKRDQNDHLE